MICDTFKKKWKEMFEALQSFFPTLRLTIQEPTLKTDSERLQASISKAGFEPTDSKLKVSVQTIDRHLTFNNYIKSYHKTFGNVTVFA